MKPALFAFELLGALGLLLLTLDYSGTEPFGLFRSRDAWIYLVLPGALLGFRGTLLLAALVKRWVRHPLLILLYLPWVGAQGWWLWWIARGYVSDCAAPDMWQ